MEIHKVVIVGAGPAGIATAIQLKRYGIMALLFEKDEVGGLLRNANLVENYPGFPGGITGADLARRFAQQLNEEAVYHIPETVTKVDIYRGTFLIETSAQRFYAENLVVASGTKPKEPALGVISPCARPHVYHEIAQLSRVKGKKFIIIGAGDAAFDYALNLSRANEVTIINRGTAVKCIPLLWNRVMNVPNVSYHTEVVISRIFFAGEGNPLNQVCVESEKGIQYWADFVIFAIGREPQLDFLSEKLILRQDELIAGGKLRFAGDVKNNNFRQTAISVGDGIMAAMVIFRAIGH
jgi:thioredoxin reductase (NADPH)